MCYGPWSCEPEPPCSAGFFTHWPILFPNVWLHIALKCCQTSPRNSSNFVVYEVVPVSNGAKHKSWLHTLGKCCFKLNFGSPTSAFNLGLKKNIRAFNNPNFRGILYLHPALISKYKQMIMQERMWGSFGIKKANTKRRKSQDQQGLCTVACCWWHLVTNNYVFKIS